MVQISKKVSVSNISFREKWTIYHIEINRRSGLGAWAELAMWLQASFTTLRARNMAFYRASVSHQTQLTEGAAISILCSSRVKLAPHQTDFYIKLWLAS